MHGPGSHLFSQSVNGQDFLDLCEKAWVDDVRVTPFVARKLVKLRSMLMDET